MQKVPKRNKNITIPYELEPYEQPESSAQLMAEKDYDTVKELVKSGNKQRLRDFINKRLTASENISATPGLSTRDYMSALTGEAVKRKYPEIRKAALEGTPDELGRAVQKVMLPDVEKSLKSYNLGAGIESGEKDTTNEETGLIRLSGRETPSGNIGTAVHENAHILDALAKKYSKAKYIAKAEGRDISPERESVIREFLKKKPAATSLFQETPGEDEKFKRYTTEKESLNKYGGRFENPEIPNFEDYDFKTGQFQSDVIKDPIDVQKESGEYHHLDRNQPYENMIKTLEDDGSLERVTKQDRFKKLRSLIS
jgi:hypothetical protein